MTKNTTIFPYPRETTNKDKQKQTKTAETSLVDGTADCKHNHAGSLAGQNIFLVSNQFEWRSDIEIIPEMSITYGESN